jgi:nitrogen fixation-related uncharacterized protein
VISTIADPSGRDNEEFNNNYTVTKKNIETPSQDDVRCYSKAVPNVQFDELKEKAEERLIEEEKLREYATEYWEKRKEQTGKNVRV